MKTPAPSADSSERDLVAAAQADPRQFAPLYERTFEQVYGYIARRVQNRAEAEDVTSEVFQRALAALPQYEWRGTPFVAWLLRIAAHALADRYAKSAREQGTAAAEPIDDTTMREVEARATLFQLVEVLPPEQRRVVEMRFAEGKSIREIARALQRSEGAIKQLQYRALESLRARVRGGVTAGESPASTHAPAKEDRDA
jgi:RNA polymerase sigma-70 factor, ECF subfamily